MGLHDRLHQAEPEPYPAFGAACLAAVQTAEYRFTLCLGDARARVGDGDDDRSRAAQCGQGHPGPGRRVFQGVVQEVVDGLPQADRVDVGLDRLGLFKGHGDPLFLGNLAIEVGGPLRQRAQVDAAAVQLEGRRLGRRNIQEGLEQVEKPVRLVDAVGERRPGLGRVSALAQRQFRACAQPGERRAQVVGEVVKGLAQHPDVCGVLVEKLVQLVHKDRKFPAAARGRDSGIAVPHLEDSARSIGYDAKGPCGAPGKDRPQDQREQECRRPHACKCPPQRREKDRLAVHEPADMEDPAVGELSGGDRVVERGVLRDPHDRTLNRHTGNQLLDPRLHPVPRPFVEGD